MQFRSDIAGLRAFAVLPILLFHAGLSWLPGGFVGVDVFFVISGYLITSIVSRDMELGRFSILEFYRRRVARILPALIVVIFAVLAAGVALLLPFELTELGHSAAAAAGFVSNFYFVKAADYFGGAAEGKPLLHTWSLAVEEQFYIFYPLVLMIVRRWAPRHVATVILAMSAGSLIVAFVLGQYKADAAFYLIPARAWELGIGGLVALDFYPKVRSRELSTLLAGAGLAAIAFAVLFVRPDMPFPAPWAIFPVLGTALVIAYAPKTAADAVLSAPFLQFFGNISYSLYLWHWPVITFYRLMTGIELHIGESVSLIAISIIISWVSYRWIEMPAQARLRSGAAKGVCIAGGAALVLTLGAALAVSLSADNLVRFPPEVKRIASFANYRETPESKYQYKEADECISHERERNPSGCMNIDPSRYNVLIFGDSHASQYWRAFVERFPEKNVMRASTSGCRPTVETYGLEKCTEMVRYVLEALREKGGVQSVVLVGRWRPKDIALAQRTVRDLVALGIKVTVVGPMVEYDGDYPLILARAELAGTKDDLARMRLAQRREVDLAMKPAIAATGAVYVSAYDIECPSGQCILMADGDPMHFDYGHLTMKGARYMVSRMPVP